MNGKINDNAMCFIKTLFLEIILANVRIIMELSLYLYSLLYKIILKHDKRTETIYDKT